MLSQFIDIIGQAAMIFGIGAGLDVMVRSPKKRRYADLLFEYRPNFVSESAQIVIDLFSLVFDGNKGKISIFKSFAVSVFLFIIISYFVSNFAKVNIFEVLFGGTKKNMIGLVLVLVANLFGDYLSLKQTKYFMNNLIGQRIHVQLIGFVADAVATFLIIAGFIAVFFWSLANIVGEPGWSGWRPIPWQMCHQLNSTALVFSSNPQSYENNCDFIMQRTPGISGPVPNFENIFNASALLTTYATSAWLLFFFIIQASMGALQYLFKRFSKKITKYVNYRQYPFSLTAIFVAVIYLSLTLIYSNFQ